MAGTGSASHRVAAGSGTEVLRSRILSYIEKACPRVVFVSAPSGYGKTVLAAQVAELSRFSRCVWLACDGHELAGDALLAEIVAVAKGVSTDELFRRGGSPEVLPDVVDSMALLARVLENERNPICIVLDDARIASAVREIAELAALISSGGADHALVVATRDVPREGAVGLRGFLSVDVEDLLFDEGEVSQLIARVVGETQADGLSRVALELSGGQAALASVLASHAAMRGGTIIGSERSLDLTGLLVALADAQLGDVEIEMLSTISLLGHATHSELVTLDPAYRGIDLTRLSRCIPLLRPVADSCGRVNAVHMHDIAQDVYGSPEFVQRHGSDRLREIRSSCSRLLEHRRDYPRLIPMLVEQLPHDELAQWLLAHGERVASCGYGLDLGRALEVLPASLLLSHPRLLLMGAEYGPVASDAAERMERASLAKSLATCEGDFATVADALLAKAAAAKDLGRVRQSCESLKELLDLPAGAVDLERKMLSVSHLLTLMSVMFEREDDNRLRMMLDEALSSGSLRGPVVARICIQLGSTEVFKGRTSDATAMFLRAADMGEMPLVLRAMMLGNFAMLMTELGRLARARELAEEHLKVSQGHGLETYRAAGDGIRAVLAFLASSETVGLVRLGGAIDSARSVGDRATESNGRIQRALLLRSIGDLDGAMVDVEVGLEHATSHGMAYHLYLAKAELAANFLALGDLEAAARHALHVRKVCAPNSALHQVIRVDLVLAEVARRQGRTEDALDRLLAHEEYILEDNANFVIAIYIRAFPALLGLLALAIGANRLPPYMLRMVTGRYAEDALIAARDLVPASEWSILASRLPAEPGFARLELLSSTPPCHVRLFGGFTVTIGDREVPEGDWTKRKSRLLFAMLVLQYGHDLSRESIYEHLWPEMTESRARNNLYVTWSAMKAALMPEADRNVACPYASHKNGVCHISTSLVSSDVARFDTLFAEGRAAETAGDQPAALRAYEGLVDVYRGELLPGDIYDDWFSSARDRYRQDFAEGMLAAHRILSEQGDHTSALRMVRRGIAADSWREDLYQAALRSQIALGQRSAAVETYMACRSCLADDLGLDPSGETVRLYERILAMEDGPNEISYD